ncbi:MAG TPA: hypothetical protein VFQ61_04785 [Polyangiaceae bacterium]|nr:hypothetical protein [Polyangiaceae bacterium]
MSSNRFGLGMVLFVSSALCAFVGCGDDDDNPTPSKGGSQSSGGKTSKGGASSGGDTSDAGESATGGTGGTTSKGGASNTGGKSSTGGKASGGEPPVEGGAGAQGGETSTGEGGAGNSTSLSDCDEPNSKGCYEDCKPVEDAHFLDACTGSGVECTPFDNSILTKLKSDGSLPDLP